MSFEDADSSDLGLSGPPTMERFLFSCELSSKVPFFTFQGDEEDDTEHFLEFRTVCLGEGAKEESNVVEVTAMNHQGKTISVSLGEFELKAPVNIRLKAGTGPVNISGLHFISSQAEESDLSGDEDDDDDELEDDDEDLSPIKPAKKKQKP